MDTKTLKTVEEIKEYGMLNYISYNDLRSKFPRMPLGKLTQASQEQEDTLLTRLVDTPGTMSKCVYERLRSKFQSCKCTHLESLTLNVEH